MLTATGEVLLFLCDPKVLICQGGHGYCQLQGVKLLQSIAAVVSRSQHGIMSNVLQKRCESDPGRKLGGSE